MTTGKALNGKPDAGNPHVRFDEGEVASAATPRHVSALAAVICVAMVALPSWADTNITTNVTLTEDADWRDRCVVNIASGVTMPTVLPNSGALFGTKSWSTIQRACHPHCRHDHNSPAIKDHRQ